MSRKRKRNDRYTFWEFLSDAAFIITYPFWWIVCKIADAF